MARARIGSLFAMVLVTACYDGLADDDVASASQASLTIGPGGSDELGSGDDDPSGVDGPADDGVELDGGELEGGDGASTDTTGGADGTSAGDDASTASDDGTTGMVDTFDHGLCGDAPPMGSPVPPAPPGYSGGACPALVAGYNTGFVSGGLVREFALIVPSAVDDTGTYPLVFGWYHISGNAMEFVADLQAQTLADAGRAIIVVPQDSGMFQTVWPDTPLDIAQAGVDLAMFDDLYACISQQFPINTNCVGSLGVSAGGLWTSYLGSVRGQYLASNVTISGGHPSEFVGPWWPWVSPRPFASLVMWGGPTDVLGIDFNAASLNLVGDYVGSGHFVLRCEHGNGHGIPPAGDGDPLGTVLHFGRNHPFWLNGASPLDMGLPAFYPSYCTVL